VTKNATEPEDPEKEKENLSEDASLDLIFKSLLFPSLKKVKMKLLDSPILILLEDLDLKELIKLENYSPSKNLTMLLLLKNQLLEENGLPPTEKKDKRPLKSKESSLMLEFAEKELER
jgi:hypothetical protein